MIYLVINNVKQFIVQQRLIFVLFMVSQLVSTLSIIFIYGIVVSQQKDEIFYNERIRTFTVEPLFGFDRSQEQRLMEVLEEKKGLIRSITVHIQWENDEIVRAHLIYPEKSFLPVYYGRYFSEEDFLRGARQIVLCERLTQGQKKVGEIFNLNNREYEIIGLFLNSGYHEIPYRSIGDHDRISTITVTLEEAPNRRAVEQWLAYLCEKFSGAAVTAPEIPDLRYTAQNFYRIVSSIIVGLLAVLNYSYLYSYILFKRQGQYAALRMCGCSIFQGAVIYLSEVLLLSISQFALSSIVFHKIISAVFPKILEHLKYLLVWDDYLLLFALYLTTVLLIFMPVIYGFSRRKPVELWREDFT